MPALAGLRDLGTSVAKLAFVSVKSRKLMSPQANP
jgi:hypothetical protein